MSEKTKSRRLNRVVVWGGVLAGVLLFVAALLGGVIVREGLRAAEAMKDTKWEPPAARLRALSVEPVTTDTTSRPAVPEAVLSFDERTSSTQSGVTRRHRLLIPSDVGLNDTFKHKRQEMNTAFEKFLREVEAFEREKRQLPPEVALQRLSEIYSRHDHATRINKFDLRRNNNNWERAYAEGGALADYDKIQRACYLWLDASRIELNEQAGNYRQAGFLAEHWMENRRGAWMIAHGYPNTPIYLSDYYRGSENAADYHRVVYNYWRAGGTGMLKILDVALSRMAASVADRFRRRGEGAGEK